MIDENVFYETLIQFIGPTRSHLARFARARFALRAHENFRKEKCVSIDLKCSETHKNAKKYFYPFDRLRASRVARSASGEAQPFLSHVTRRVPRSVHAKFHADWTKTVGARGIQTDRQTNRQTDKQTDRATLII